MSSRLRFSIIVAEATLLSMAGWFAIVFGTLWILGFKSGAPTVAMGTFVVLVVILLPTAVSLWWMFPRLAATCTRREARAVSTAFGVFSPIASGVGIALGGMIGGAYVVRLPGSRLFIPAGVFLGTAMVGGVLILAVCALVLRVTRLAEGVEQSASPGA